MNHTHFSVDYKLILDDCDWFWSDESPGLLKSPVSLLCSYFMLFLSFRMVDYLVMYYFPVTNSEQQKLWFS